MGGGEGAVRPLKICIEAVKIMGYNKFQTI
jgi:hypothetical protein